jgi:hypothetical protein
VSRKVGNPAWIKGKAQNPAGRPKGRYDAMLRDDPKLFSIHHMRWWKFAINYHYPASMNGAKAARLAGYSPKSARFIA